MCLFQTILISSFDGNCFEIIFPFHPLGFALNIIEIQIKISTIFCFLKFCFISKHFFQIDNLHHLGLYILYYALYRIINTTHEFINLELLF